ncbi:PAS domain S-box protein, partial [Myxococcota bacterium]|nr:PAS domain S-box protein [Myxococcota bacterium]
MSPDNDTPTTAGIPGPMDPEDSHQLREQQQALLHAAFEGSIIGKCLTSPQGILIRVNQAFCDMLHYTRNELEGESFLRFTHPDDQALSQELIQGLIRGERDSASFEKRYISKNGGVINASVGTLLIRDDQGSPCLFATDVMNITKRYRVEQELRETSEKLRVSMDEAPVGIAVVSLQRRFMHCNRTFCEFTGYSEEELRELTIADITYEPDLEIGDQDIIAIVKGEKKQAHLEKRYVRKDGAVVWGEVSINLIRTPDGEPLYFLPTIQDITERKQTEAILQAQFVTSPDIILIVNRDMRIERINKGLVTGLPPSALKGMDAIKILPAETRESMRQVLERCFESGEPQQVTHHIGNGIWVRARVVMLSQNGDTARVMIIATDITEQRKTDEERLRLQNQLNQVHRLESIGRLAGGVAHDFNNMIGAIIGNVELAMTDSELLPAAVVEHLQVAKDAALRSADLTRQLIAFASKQPIAPRVLDFNRTVQSLLKMLRRLIGENITLNFNPCHDKVCASIDPSQLDQILINLCVNARDAIRGAGEVNLETSLQKVSESTAAALGLFGAGEYIALRVTDTGEGMDSETLSRIFEPFFTTKEAGKGTGLGLATVYGSVKQNGGIITVASELGRGTTFTLYLPRIDCARADVSSTQHA